MGNLLFCYTKENNKNNKKLLDKNYDDDNDISYIHINLDYQDHQDYQIDY
jgi:hypothetical protein